MRSTRHCLAFETSEGVVIELPLAGPISRFVAWLLDEAIILTACTTLGKVLSSFTILGSDTVTALSILSYFVISVGYGIALEWRWSGQTVGKRVLGLRAVDASGGKLQLAPVAIRNLLRFLDALPGLYLVGGVAMLLSPYSQRLGDLIADTAVLRRRYAEVPHFDPGTDPAEKYNSFLEVPHLAARLRQRVRPALVDVANQALLRRGELTPAVRQAVFQEIESRFRELLQFPDELTASLTPERYVRNALQVITTTGSLRLRKTSGSEAR